MTSTWHVQSDLLERYASGDADEGQAYSVEAHLPSCAECTRQIATLLTTSA